MRHARVGTSLDLYAQIVGTSQLRAVDQMIELTSARVAKKTKKAAAY